MSNNNPNSLDPNINDSTCLKISRPHYYTIRQYIAKLDQFLCLLELDQVLFPSYVAKEMRKNFSTLLKNTKKSVNNLKTELFRLSKNTKPNGRQMSDMRFRKRKIEDNLPLRNKLVKTTKNAGEIEIIDITDSGETETVKISAPCNQADLSQMNEAAVSLLTLRGNHSVQRELTNNLCTTGHVIKLSELMKIRKFPTTQQICLLNRTSQANAGEGSQGIVRVTEPYFNNESISVEPLNPQLNPILEVDGIPYSISEINFEVVSSNNINNNNIQ
jgi:hypothetical protein